MKCCACFLFPLPCLLSAVYSAGAVHQDHNRNREMDKGEKEIPGLIVSEGVEAVTTNREGR
ncbi:MAG: hypothetical protein AMJ41_02675 [candidate division Zixibacteria bacterium DG_27]|nr:MAG: hypothetical protein AMJ41_02675 [candidate division Zixibacteria bacterium DG_27]